MFGLPFLTTSGNTRTYEEGEQSVKRYIQAITSTLEELRKKGYLPQTTPIDFKIHKFQPGGWILIKKWEGPFQILLTTEMAVRTQKRGWTHISRVKGPVSASTEGTSAPT